MAGIALSKATDCLDARLGLGEELGGLLLLSVAGSLPELAITVSAAAGGHLGLAAGNLIGGIAVQTMVLVICDFAVGRERPLTFLVGALSPVLEALLVDARRLGRPDGRAAAADDRDRRRRQPGVDRDRRRLDASAST